MDSVLTGSGVCCGWLKQLLKLVKACAADALDSRQV